MLAGDSQGGTMGHPLSGVSGIVLKKKSPKIKELKNIMHLSSLK